MSRIELDSIPFEEGDKLISKYQLTPLAPPPPKPEPGQLPMNAGTEWDTSIQDPRPRSPWALPADAPQYSFGMFIPYWTEVWVWHEGNAVILRADAELGAKGSREIQRATIRWVPSEAAMLVLQAEFNRRHRARTFTVETFAQWVDEVLPVDPAAPRRFARRKIKRDFDEVKKARKALEEAGTGIRNEGFDAWIRRYTEPADTPSGWTQSTVLYANYVKHARRWGDNRPDKRITQLMLATETRFGLLMRGIGLIKVRRSRGYFYPIRLKQGA